MSNTNSNYYNILGVSHDFQKEELRDAYRKKASENHPDNLTGLPEDERKKRENSMYEINEAYSILSNSEKKNEYDKNLRESTETKVSPEKRKSRSSAESRGSYISYKDFFNSNFNDERPYETRYRQNYASRSETTDGALSFSLPESDWGLLVALKKAYESNVDGKWRVKKPEGDKRTWMPEEVYSVKRENGEVHVYRKINDWRSEYDRNRDIEVEKEGKIFEVEKSMKPNTFLGEYYLCGDGRSRLKNEKMTVPETFGNYLQAMKSLAKKFADRETDEDGMYLVSNEIGIINEYGRSGSRNTQFVKEGEEPSIYHNDYEVVKNVKFDNFWKKMETANSSVFQVEGSQVTKERQVKVPEGAGMSGESLG